MKAITVLFALAFTGVILSGCASTTPVGGRDYYSDSVRTTGTIQMGQVLNVRAVKVHDRRSTGYSRYSGAAVGAALGGYAAAQADSNAVRALGAMVGGMVGNTVQSRSGRSQAGVELDVRLDTGKRIFVTQGADGNFRPGQRVRVMKSGGTYRVAS